MANANAVLALATGVGWTEGPGLCSSTNNRAEKLASRILPNVKNQATKKAADHRTLTSASGQLLFNVIIAGENYHSHISIWFKLGYSRSKTDFRFVLVTGLFEIGRYHQLGVFLYYIV